MRVIDLTHTIKENMPVYPGTGTPKELSAMFSAMSMAVVQSQTVVLRVVACIVIFSLAFVMRLLYNEFDNIK